MITLVQLGEYWVNPETVAYLQPRTDGGCYINFVAGGDAPFIAIKNMTPYEVARRLSDLLLQQET